MYKQIFSNRFFLKPTFLLRNVSTQLNSLTDVKEINGVREIILNDPKTRNTLSMKMMDTLIGDITNNEDNPKLRCIVLSAEGPVFSAGHNLRELVPENGSDFHLKLFTRCSELMMTILKSPVPVIAKIDGIAAAAGCQLAATCDIVVCSDSSTFSTPGASFGIFCSTPGIAVARTVSRMKASQMLLTGLPISATEACQAGLVSSTVPKENLDEKVKQFTDAIQLKSRPVIELGKKFFYQQITMDINSAYKLGADVMTKNLQLDDGMEGIRGFIEKRKPIWK